MHIDACTWRIEAFSTVLAACERAVSGRMNASSTCRRQFYLGLAGLQRMLALYLIVADGTGCTPFMARLFCGQAAVEAWSCAQTRTRMDRRCADPPGQRWNLIPSGNWAVHASLVRGQSSASSCLSS